MNHNQPFGTVLDGPTYYSLYGICWAHKDYTYTLLVHPPTNTPIDQVGEDKYYWCAYHAHYVRLDTTGIPLEVREKGNLLDILKRCNTFPNPYEMSPEGEIIQGQYEPLREE
jgi:hypothetical protein